MGNLAIRFRVVREMDDLRKLEREAQSWFMVSLIHDIRLERLARQNQMW